MFEILNCLPTKEKAKRLPKVKSVRKPRDSESDLESVVSNSNDSYSELSDDETSLNDETTEIRKRGRPSGSKNKGLLIVLIFF